MTVRLKPTCNRLPASRGVRPSVEQKNRRAVCGTTLLKRNVYEISSNVFHSCFPRLPILRHRWQRLVRSARTCRPDFARKENQWRSNRAGAPQHPEAIEKTQQGRLLVHDSRQLRFRMQSRVRDGEAARYKISRQRIECLPIALLQWIDMSNEN